MKPSFFKINRHDPRAISWWNSMRDKIDMDPSYQRKGRLWSQSDKAYLIDSLINGFDVPKFYLADFQYRDTPLNKNKKPYAIIDGKQRLEAIFDFFSNNLTLNEDFKLRSNPARKMGGLSFRDLENSYPDVAEALKNAPIDVVSVISDAEEDINDLFVRLNRSKPLTGAEIRNAMNGPVPDVIRNVARHSLFEENIKFSTKRAGDINAATKVTMFEYNQRLTNTKKSDLDRFASLKDPDLEKLELVGRKTIDNLDVMQEVFLPKDPLLSSAGVFPVYYWLVRTAPKSSLVHLREFLVQFERRRVQNRKVQRSGSDNIDDELSTYDSYNRSTDDATSHQRRYEILLNRLKEFGSGN